MRCRAHKLQHERAGPSRRGASNTSTRIAPISCANRCSHVPRVDPARQPHPDCPSESCFEALRSTSCGRAASLWIEPWMDSMSAAIFSALSIFSTTSSTSRPGWRMPKKRRHSHQRDDRDSAETSPRASNRHYFPRGLLCVFALERSTQCVSHNRCYIYITVLDPQRGVFFKYQRSVFVYER